ncbi:MAG: ATP-binding protein [Candidatus Bipolaricaulota bacterium]
MPSKASAEQDILQQQGIKSVVVVPVISRNRLIGYMGFDSVKEEKEWEDNMIRLLQMVAEVFGSTLAREDIERKLEDLHGIAINLHRHRGESEICREVVAAAEDVIDLSNSMIALREGDRLVPKASSSGVDPEQLKVLRVGEGIGGRTVKEREPIWGNVADLADVGERGIEYKSVLSVPIGDLGNFQAVSEREDAFSKNDLRLATLLASHIEDELLRRDYEEKLIDAKAELEESRKKYKQLVENQGEGIISIDENWKVVFANPAAAEIVGFDTVEETIGKDVSEYLEEGQWRKVEGQIEERYKGESNTYELEIFRPNEGDHRVILVTARPRLDDEGNTTGSFAILRDITDRVEAERELKQLNERMREMTNMVAHELRIPLTTIRGYADMLKDGLIGDTSDDQQDILDKISRSSERLSDLTKNFLDLEKIESGQFNLGQVRMKVDELIKEVLVEASAHAEDKGLELSSDLEEGLSILGDRQKLFQAFSNLIANAIKFTPAGSIWIRAERGEDGVTVEVEDEGVGIKQEDLEHIFDKFYQAETSGIRTANGTGLGLTLVQKVVEAHGGSVEITSRLEEGTTVKVHLPES